MKKMKTKKKDVKYEKYYVKYRSMNNLISKGQKSQAKNVSWPPVDTLSTLQSDLIGCIGNDTNYDELTVFIKNSWK